MNFLTFLLETTGGTTGNTSNTGALGGGMGFTWIIMILMLVGMWWFTSRSQKKKDQEAQNMRDSLQVGDEVTTIDGIIGKVVSIKEETFVLETTKEKTHIRFLKGAIRSVDVRVADLAAASEAKEAPAEEATTEDKKPKFSFFNKKNK